MTLFSIDFTKFHEQVHDIKEAESCISRTYSVLLNWHEHYGKFSQKIHTIRDNLSYPQLESGARIKADQIQ